MTAAAVRPVTIMFGALETDSNFPKALAFGSLAIAVSGGFGGLIFQFEMFSTKDVDLCYISFIKHYDKIDLVSKKADIIYKQRDIYRSVE